MKRRAPLLFLTVLVIATSGLVYELLAGALASYVLGDSVTQFSTTIGVYMFAMGIGSYLSRFIEQHVAARFVEVEIGAALAGGFSAPLLFLTFTRSELFGVVLYGLIVVIGTLVGLEIPLLMRILREDLEFKELVAKVLTFDYLGALLGSLLFALVLVPSLGLNRTALCFGLLNCAVALMSTWVLHDVIATRTKLRLRIQAVVAAALLVAGLVHTDEMVTFGEQAFYGHPVVYAKQSRYQRIVLTRSRASVQLFLNGRLQFSSSDEYRYHEALVHPAFAATERRERVLVLGGGDGLALREVYRHPEVKQATLVDLDEQVTHMASELEVVRQLNEASLDDPRTTVVNADAMVWLDQYRGDPFDVVLIDFPDPSNFSLGKLYTRRFYQMVTRVMHRDSALVVQSTSPYYARRAFWCVATTMAEAGLSTAPFHVALPSFGDWGYVLAMKRPFDPPRKLPLRGLRFLSDAILPTLFVFSEDMAPVDVEGNRLNNQRLVHYYEQEQSRWR